VVTTYTTAQIDELDFTQSVDVMILVHPEHPPRKLSRLTSTSFSLDIFVVREGPFKPIDTDEAVRIASDKVAGSVTLTANSSVFTNEMEGSYLYLEQKALGQVKPWSQGDRDVAVGEIRRSDGKTYICTAVASGGTWTESGGTRPTHEHGREWDGPGDTRTDGTSTWAVGAQWEYHDSGYGIVKMVTYSSGTSMAGEVVRRLPQGVVGGLGAALTTWNLVGDGTTKAFTLAGKVSNSRSDFEATIGGTLYQPDPYYIPVIDFPQTGTFF
jgi:hypothetical protein